MNILLSSQAGLRQFYGEREAQQVLAATERLLQIRNQRGIASHLLLVEQGLSQFGIPGAANTAATIAGQLRQVAEAYETVGDRLESVLIIGGPAIIPFEHVPNPTPYDGDPDVPSDLMYSVRTAGALLPEWPIGRLPGTESEPHSVDLLLRLIQQTIRLHTLPQPVYSAKPFGYSTAVWQAASAQVYSELSATPLQLSPPTVAATLDRGLLDRATAVYCNLHGVRDGASWYGQSSSGASYLVALRPEDVLAVKLAGAVVFSEACYSAVVAGRDQRSSLALALLARGAAAFIGATAMSYGPAIAPLGEADLLALHFWRALRQGSPTVGAAFVEARAQMLLSMLATQPMLDGDDRKTLLEFVLYGDPTVAVA